MTRAVSARTLERETEAFRGTGGISAENGCYGFQPAFLDTATHRIFPSSFADGRPSPFHVLDGLPEDVVLTRSPCGRVTAVKSSIVSGFIFKGRFYNREDAAEAILDFSLD